jgi:hypothetical protein
VKTTPDFEIRGDVEDEIAALRENDERLSEAGTAGRLGDTMEDTNTTCADCCGPCPEGYDVCRNCADWSGEGETFKAGDRVERGEPGSAEYDRGSVIGTNNDGRPIVWWEIAETKYVEDPEGLRREI